MGFVKAVSGLTNFLIKLQFKLSRADRAYILPTGFGLAFAVMILVLFFLAAGASNNLVFLVVFFLISVSLTGVYWTNRNIDIVRIEGCHGEPGFAGEGVTLQVFLKNKSTHTQAEYLKIFCLQNRKKVLVREGLVVQPASSVSVDVSCVFAQRGWHQIPRIYLESNFPFGLLRSWKLLQSQTQVLIFPRLQGDKEFPPEVASQVQEENLGIFREHRQYKSGDSPRRIDWKVSARRQAILVKNFEEPKKGILNFHWNQTQHLPDPELRLSQLALWVDQAEKRGLIYSMQIGDVVLAASRGHQHWQACLEALALFNTQDGPR